MAINERLIDTKVEAAAPVGNEAEQGLILHLDANDVDSYDGDGTEWVDISEYDVTIPLSDNADDLELHLNASDSTSYDPATDTTTWTDISGNSNDATLTSLTNTDYDIDNGGFFTLDGASDFASNTSVSLGTDSGSYSTEMWFNADTIAANDILFQLNGVGTSRRHLLYFNSTSTVRALSYRASDLNNSAAATSGTISTGTWYHVVAVFKDDTYLKLYVNGVEVATTSSNVTDARPTSYDEYYIGKEDDFGQKFDGKIGAVRYYSKALSASEVGQNYRHGRDIVYTDLIPDTDLELHLDAGDDTTVSASTWSDKANSNNGTLTNFSSTLIDFYEKELGNYIEFDGSNDKVVFGSSAITAFNSDDRTIEMWFNTNSNTTTQVLFNADGNTFSYGRTTIATTTSGQIQALIGDAGSYPITSISANRWYHIAVSKSGTSYTLYLDGEEKGTATANTYSDTVSSEFKIGENIGSNLYPFSGKVGQVRAYSTALTQDQIRQNYNFTKPNYPNGINASLTNVSWAANYFEIDSSSDAIEFGNGLKPYLDGLTTVLSTSYWIRFDDLDATQHLFAYYNSSLGGDSAGFSQGMVESGKLQWYVSPTSGTTNGRTTSVCVTANTWHHVVMVLDMSKSQTNGTGGRVQIFVDETEQSITYTESTGSTTLRTGSASLKPSFGFTTNSSGTKENHFDGRVSKIKIYDKALTQAEITALYNEGE